MRDALAFLVQQVLSPLAQFVFDAACWAARNFAGLVGLIPPAILAGAGSLLLGAWLWYRATTGREARGGHLWWPGRIEDRW